MNKVLHLTHTEIETDSRILKEMGSLVGAGYVVSGLGVAVEEGAQRSALNFAAETVSIILRSRKFTFLPRTLRHMASLIELIFKMLPRAFRQEPDVVHCHDTLVLPIGVFIKLFTGAKLVYDAHELESDRNGLTKLQSRLTLWMEKLLWRFVDALIVVSPSIERWYRDNIGPKRSAVILNSPLYGEDGSTGGDYLRKRFSIPAGERVFIYVGILGRGRGLDFITEAFMHPDVSSHIVFLGYGESIDELKRLASSHRNLHVHPAVPHSQVVPIVKSADFGLCLIQNVSLSDYYCLPNKLFEYCFAGVPVLASDFPDIRDLVADYGIGECCSLDSEVIRDAVLRLQNSNRIFEFSDLGPLSWQEQERRLVALYKDIIRVCS